MNSLTEATVPKIIAIEIVTIAIHRARFHKAYNRKARMTEKMMVSKLPADPHRMAYARREFGSRQARLGGISRGHYTL